MNKQQQKTEEALKELKHALEFENSKAPEEGILRRAAAVETVHKKRKAEMTDKEWQEEKARRAASRAARPKAGALADQVCTLGGHHFRVRATWQMSCTQSVTVQRRFFHLLKYTSYFYQLRTPPLHSNQRTADFEIAW